MSGPPSRWRGLRRARAGLGRQSVLGDGGVEVREHRGQPGAQGGAVGPAIQAAKQGLAVAVVPEREAGGVGRVATAAAAGALAVLAEVVPDPDVLAPADLDGAERILGADA